MRPNYSITQLQKDLDDKLSKGKIRGYVMPVEVKKSYDKIVGRKVAKHFEKKSKGLNYIAKNLLFFCQERCLTLYEEYRFHETRKWRFDFAIITDGLKIAVEFEGSIHNPQGDHRSIRGIKRDVEKYNAATGLGWHVLRFHALNYETLITELEKNFLIK